MKRWLYVLWLAGLIGCHQAGAAASPTIQRAAVAQWQVAQSDSASSCAELTPQSAADLEDQSFAKRSIASAHACVEYQSGHETPGQLLIGTVNHDEVREVSAVIIGRQSIRGPPVSA